MLICLFIEIQIYNKGCLGALGISFDILATLAQGCAGEVHMNMDVNLHWLPEENKNEIEILSASCSSYGASGFGE